MTDSPRLRVRLGPRATELALRHSDKASAESLEEGILALLQSGGTDPQLASDVAALKSEVSAMRSEFTHALTERPAAHAPDLGPALVAMIEGMENLQAMLLALSANSGSQVERAIRHLSNHMSERNQAALSDIPKPEPTEVNRMLEAIKRRMDERGIAESELSDRAEEQEL